MNPQTQKRVKIEQRGFLYAVRDEVMSPAQAKARGTKLGQWYFIDSKTDLSTLRTFFLDLPHQPKLPITSSRQIPS